MRLGRGDRLVAGTDEARPQALDVERRRERHGPDRVEPVETADEHLGPVLVAELVDDLRRRGIDDRQLDRGRRAGSPRRGPAASGIPSGAVHAGQRLGHADRCARQDRGHARMGVVGDRPADELDDDDPADAADDLGPARSDRSRRPRSARPPPGGSRAARSSSASRCSLPYSSSPSTRNRTRQGSGPIVARYASTAQIRGMSSPLLSVAPRA